MGCNATPAHCISACQKTLLNIHACDGAHIIYIIVENMHKYAYAHKDVSIYKYNILKNMDAEQNPMYSHETIFGHMIMKKWNATSIWHGLRKDYRYPSGKCYTAASRASFTSRLCQQLLR